MSSRRAVALVVAVLAGVMAPAAAAESWQASALDLSLAWQVTSGSAGTVVAVVDSGVQADDAALQGRVLAGYDVINGDTNTADGNGHGSAVAGIVSSVCPACRILPVKVIAANGTADWTTIASGIVWAADHGADVINLSIGAPRAVDAVGAAVAYALSKGVIVVAAAGNDGADESFYPAMYPGVVSVAGVDEAGGRSTWSNFGSWVTTAAPWCATASPGFCGTSAAAPFVAGIAGLARAFDPELAPSAFASALATSTTPLPDPTTAASGFPDANRLLVAIGAPAAPPIESAPPTVLSPPIVGRRCTASGGTWSEASSYRITWQRFRPGAGWANLTSGATYTPRARDAGYRLRVVVAAANVRGTVTEVSPATPPVGAPRTRRGGAASRPPRRD